MNNSKKQLENLKKKINHLQHDKENESMPKRSKYGAGFGFKISTEIVAALIVGVGHWSCLWIITFTLNLLD